jgi:triosephosphate isomerase (TIM)
MTHTNTPLVVANWKMNPGTLLEAKTIFTGTKAAAKKYPHAHVVAAVPALYALELKKLLGTGSLSLGLQTAHEAMVGAFTGEIGIAMLQANKIGYVILGHSERRLLGETDEAIARKVPALLKAKITPIICVGEKDRDSQGNFYTLIEAQITKALSGIKATALKDIVIAYEPIWAIGTGKTAQVEDVYEMQLFIEKILTKLFNRAAARKVRIIYGGSVNADNAETLFRQGNVAGFLVGGASLKPVEFTKIIAATVK